MNRNLFLLLGIFTFWVGLHAIHHWILIIDHPQASNVYMSNKENKIKKVKIFHKAAKDNYIFAKMMANNKESLINAVITNHPKFWDANNQNGIYEGFDSKFDKLIQNIIKDGDLQIDYKRSIKLGNARYTNNIQEQLYQLDFNCDYKDLVAFIAALEKNDRIYNIKDLKLKNPLQKNIAGINVHMKVNEINIGK
tara:strand:+ start:3180 stop:3761 length:582 start_codon:yes stop_codon:yes gene_type:complete